MNQNAAADEFATGLRALGVRPRRQEGWLAVGEPARAAGWKLHVSATVTGVDQLFESVLPCLVRQQAHFKMAADRAAIVQLSDGRFGETQIGKIITVYPRDDTEAIALARELIEHTRGLAGPRVPTDLHLGGAVYARYGSMRPRIAHDRFGEPSELIPDGSGNWMPDLRAVPFAPPPGIPIPFPVAKPPEAPPEPQARRLLAGRYFVTDAVRPEVAGSVLRAIDVSRARSPTGWVLKQARPHCSTDERGRDRRVRLRHEGAVLRRLRGLRGIAAVGDYFEDEGSGYLPIAYVPGETLGALVHQLVAGRTWTSVRPQARQRLLQYIAQLVHRLRAAHDRGVIHRDVAPGNVWISHDDHVYLLDWECAHVIGSRSPVFRLGTPGFSDGNARQRAPRAAHDWQACGRVLAFTLTGLDPATVVHGGERQLAIRLAELTGLRGAALIELLARALADRPSEQLDAPKLLRAIASLMQARTARRQRAGGPLFTRAARAAVLAEGLELLTAGLRSRLQRLHVERSALDGEQVDAHSGIAGMLYVLAAAHSARVHPLDTALAERVVQALTAGTRVVPDLPGLVHGSAGRALGIAAAMQAGCVRADDTLHAHLRSALAGRLDWPDFTHGAAGQGFAALACARRLDMPELAAGAQAAADYLVRTQGAEGAWTLPEGVAGATGQRFTGFAHGAAGIMAFLGHYAALARDAAADAAWRRAEAWLMSRARRARGGRWQWPQSDSRPAPASWWCHGAPGIALGWLCVAQAQTIRAIAQEALRGALASSPHQLRSDSLSQCHGLAGVGEIYLEAARVLAEERWRERAEEIANVLVALFRRRSPQPWPVREGSSDADGLMLGSAGILHFLLRCDHSAVITSAPLLA